jgi:hypothetical protein
MSTKLLQKTSVLNPNKFGFYQVGNKQFYSKLEAAEYGKEIHWNFNDEVFTAQDWTVEPKMSLWEMYKERAQQIRAMYDHVVLFYSGGADSHNMLSAWIAAGCQIDEVCTYWDYPTTKDPDSVLNAEIIKVAHPHLQKLKEQFPFLHTCIDMAEVTQAAFSDKTIDYQYNMNFWWVAYALSKSKFREIIPHWRAMIANGKKVAFVYAMEKPMLMWENKYYAHFHDMLDDNGSIPYMQRNAVNGWFDEFFYWTPDYPEIPIKQCHLLKRFVERVDDEDCYRDLKPNEYLRNYNVRLNKVLKDDMMNCLLYPRWNPDTFSVGKSLMFDFKNRPTGIIGAKDPVFLKTQTDASKRYLDLFRSAIKKFRSLNHLGINQLKKYHSKRYYLE